MLAWYLFTSFTAISLVHVYWALGGSWGSDAAIPRLPGRGVGAPSVAAFKPSAVGTLMVAVALALVATLVSLRAGLLGPRQLQAVIQYLLVGVALLMLARAVGDFRLVGFFKRIQGSPFAWLDTWIYSPLCVLLGSGLAWLAVA